MKTILALFSLMILVSCGKGVSDKPFSPADIRQVWNSTDGVTGQADLRDMTNITIYSMEKEGVVSDCVYSSDNLNPVEQYGTVNFSLIAGDSFVCDAMVGKVIYFAFTDNDEKETTMQLGKSGSKSAYYFKL